MRAPTFSIVIPTHGRPQKLGQCLDHIARLARPRDDFEVVVVDDGSPARLDDVVRALDALDVKLLHQTQSGPSVARNHGARIARGRYLAFTDDDCGPRPDWLDALERAHQASTAAAVGGVVTNAAVGNTFAAANAALLAFVTAYFREHNSSLGFYTSNNLSVPRDRFLEIGGFNEANRRAAGEDRMFCHEWLKRGWPLVNAPDAVVDHFHDQSLRGFLAMHYRYGRGARTFHRLNRVPTRDLSHAAGLPFYAQLVRWPFAREPAAAAARTLSLMLLAQAVEAAGYLHEFVRSGQLKQIWRKIKPWRDVRRLP